jgi:hypothetical protein
MDIKQINSAIMFSQWTDTELSSMIDAIKWARANLVKRTKAAIALGDLVEFTSQKTGMTYQGNVTKIAQKYVTVRTSQGLWRVPANMLRVAEVA